MNCKEYYNRNRLQMILLQKHIENIASRELNDK